MYNSGVMSRHHVPSLVVAAAAAAALCVLQLAAVTRLTGADSVRPDVLAGLIFSLAASYLAVLAVACVAASVASRLRHRLARMGSLGLLVLVANAALLFAPLAPVVLLAGMCRLPALCPESADPIVGALMAVVMPGRAPLFSPWIALGAVALSHWLARREPA